MYLGTPWVLVAILWHPQGTLWEPLPYVVVLIQTGSVTCIIGPGYARKGKELRGVIRVLLAVRGRRVEVRHGIFL